MYDWLRHILSRLFSREQLLAMEPTLRWWLAQLYRGKRRYCPICDRKLSQFIPREGGEQLCPRCGSLGYHRRLWTLLAPDLEAHPGTEWLHLNPPRPLRKRLTQEEMISYCPHEADHLAVKGTYHRIVTPPWLTPYQGKPEAMAQLFALLKPGGKMYVPEPSRSDRQAAMKSPVEALEAEGFTVKILIFDQQAPVDTRRRGLSATERVLIVQKEP